MVWAPYLLLVIVGLVLPSDGEHGPYNPKALAFFFAGLGTLLYALLLRRYTALQVRLVAVWMLVMALLLASWCLGLGYGEIPLFSQFDQWKLFVVTVSALTMALFLVSSAAFPFSLFVKTAVYANGFYALCKLMAAVLHLTGIVNLFSFMEHTGLRFMSMDIAAGVVRLQTSVDVATPFLLLFVLFGPSLQIRWPSFFLPFYVPITLVSVFLSFSRYLMFVSFLALLFSWLTTTPLKKYGIALLSVAMTLAFLGMVGVNFVEQVIERRLYSNDNYLSDRTRLDQVRAMEEEIVRYPFFGKGIGGFSSKCVRDATLPHSYEVQWVAFAMQFGLLGVTVIALSLLALGWRYWFPPYTVAKISFGSLYFLWLLSGFTNPFLISLTSGIMYALFYQASLRLEEGETRGVRSRLLQK